jgi:predicted acylesterase/phospholipase RssA
MHLTVDQAIHEYIRLADAVFQSPSRLSMPDYPLFDGKALEDHLRKTIAHYLGDPETLLYDTFDLLRCRTAVLAATSANLDALPYVFRSYASYPIFTLVNAVRATSATPGLFPAVSLPSNLSTLALSATTIRPRLLSPRRVTFRLHDLWIS